MSATFGAPDAPTVVPLEQGYRIAPLDTLTVKVFKMPDLSGDYEVDLTGQISMPLIGEIRAVDLTTAELDQRLTAKLGEKYLENPDVSVGVKSSTRRNVTVDGAVAKAGTFPVNGPTDPDPGGCRRPAARRRSANAAAGGDFPPDRRPAAGGGVRPDQHPPRRSADPPVYAGDIVVVDGSAIKALQKQILNSLPILSIFRPF